MSHLAVINALQDIAAKGIPGVNAPELSWYTDSFEPAHLTAIMTQGHEGNYWFENAGGVVTHYDESFYSVRCFVSHIGKEGLFSSALTEAIEMEHLVTAAYMNQIATTQRGRCIDLGDYQIQIQFIPLLIQDDNSKVWIQSTGVLPQWDSNVMSDTSHYLQWGEEYFRGFELTMKVITKWPVDCEES